ncbi:MAG: hypothetical protein KBG48_35780 [Kofleriaceae bacterium]|nr:hypothetical protein [Kofleriaceae bacterium]MBP9172776.1 hypothetical protein [Kofleriaceae bacterium]MBP9862371.1 hypothetical protein [Kofleriaceae bacterium]
MSARLVLAVGLLGLLGLLAAATGVATADPRARWSGPVGCGSDAALAARIGEHLGRPLAASDGVRAAVAVERAPIERELVAQISIVTPSARTTREVRGADCAAVLEAVALVVATAVDDARDARDPRHRRDDARDDVDDDPLAPPGADGAAPPRPRLPPRYGLVGRARVHLRVDGWSDAGTMPELRLGAGATLAVSYARFRAEVGAAAWRVDWVAGGGESPIGLGEVDVRGCGAAWRVWLCGGAHVGRFSERGAADQRWSAVALSVRWTRPLGDHAAVSAAIDGLGMIDRLRLADGMAAPRTAPVAVRIGLAVEAIVF